MVGDLNWNSRHLTQGWQRGVNAFFWGLGLTEEDLHKPQVGIGTPLLEGNLCNVHAYELAKHIQAGCKSAGLIGFPFGVPAVSDNLVQGGQHGGASLASRNQIANATDMVCNAHRYDAIVGLHHCDKNGPGFAMALARLNFPGLIVNGGSIMPGCHQGNPTTIFDVYDAQTKLKAGLMAPQEAETILRTACPGPGGCGIAASFNTWGIAMEAIGLSLPDTSSIPAIDAGKKQDCLRVGAAIRNLLERNIRPRDILTKNAFV
ncbi:MAG: dihydroxy-acid dehydratase, partial [Pirellula sp.]